MKTFHWFAIFAVVYCLVLSLLFVQDISRATGDEARYIDLANQFLGNPNSGYDLSHRQPLYSMGLAVLISAFDVDGFVRPLTVIQFLLVFVSAILTYKIFERLGKWNYLPLIVSVSYLLSFSTLVYAFSVLTETLAQFIFLLLVYLLIILFEKPTITKLSLIGLLSGLIVLARFNAIGLPVIVLLVVAMIYFKDFRVKKVSFLLLSLGIFLMSASIPLLAWSYYNYKSNDYFGVLPPHHLGQRWAIPALIDENLNVSPEHEELLQIFLIAKEEARQRSGGNTLKKGSLMNIPVLGNIYQSIKPKVNGFHVYFSSIGALVEYFEIDFDSNYDIELGKRLKPFFEEVKQQNRTELLKMRLFTMLETFRASNSTFPAGWGINLNAFPAPVLTMYKLGNLLVFTAVYIISFFVALKLLLEFFRTGKTNMVLLLLILMVAYFPVSNIYANVLTDANRFKFPAEPILYGLFVYYAHELTTRLKSRYRQKAIL